MKILASTLVLGLTLILSCTQKSPSPERLEEVPFISIENNQEKNFYLYVPKGYDDDPTKKWPVIMFLHGNGERGNGKDELAFTLAHGPIYEAWVQRRDLPFLIIGPQLPLYGMDTIGIPYLENRDITKFPKRLEEGVPPREPFYGSDQPIDGNPADSIFPFRPEEDFNGWHRIESDVMDVLEIVKKEYRTDESRVYLSGISYGGRGTWYMASKYPDAWAAINPIVGFGHPDLMESIAKAKVPVWCFAGGRDGGNNHVKYFYPGMNKLEELGHKDIRFTVHEEMGHDTWKRVYEGEDIYRWFLNHSKE